MIEDAQIELLLVTHRSVNDGNHRPVTDNDRLRVNTCLREVEVGLGTPELSAGRHTEDTEMLSGAHAYRRLLEITSGLHSEIPGETNVFGQFRRAWQAFATGNHRAAAGLKPIMQRLFDDTKRIRRRWLQGIGGHSYGSLVRRLIQPRPEDRVLFVGTGDLMQSILPLFGKYQLGIWNRSRTEAPDRQVRLFMPEDGQAAARWAEHVILTTPADVTNDARWRNWLITAQPGTIVHAGHRDNRWFETGAVTGNIDLYCLDDLFRLRHELAHTRAIKLDRARHACAELAEYAAGMPGPTLIAA